MQLNNNPTLTSMNKIMQKIIRAEVKELNISEMLLNQFLDRGLRIIFGEESTKTLKTILKEVADEDLLQEIILVSVYGGLIAQKLSNEN